ncbi:MAG: hypothetical protein FJW30_16970 [Acidobacteria bacterium]|nr:hypothetical protein [Acidobacteriota bacterium]
MNNTLRAILATAIAAANEIPVSITGSAAVSSPPAAMARQQAAGLLARAGVALHWCGQCRNRFGVIRIALIDQAPPDTPERILAQARFGQGRELWIFLDRVRNVNGATMFTRVLAHVIVHELVHLLQRSNRHTEEGIMKARWDAADYEAIRRGTMRLSETDVELLHAGLAKRLSALSPTLVADARSHTAQPGQDQGAWLGHTGLRIVD